MELVDLSELLKRDPGIETGLLLDKFEKVNGVWTFEMASGYWGEIPSDPALFVGLVYHLLQKPWFTKNDALILTDWATVKFGWNIHEADGGGLHDPDYLDLAARSEINKRPRVERFNSMREFRGE